MFAFLAFFKALNPMTLLRYAGILIALGCIAAVCYKGYNWVYDRGYLAGYEAQQPVVDALTKGLLDVDAAGKKQQEALQGGVAPAASAAAGRVQAAANKANAAVREYEARTQGKPKTTTPVLSNEAIDAMNKILDGVNP